MEWGRSQDPGGCHWYVGAAVDNRSAPATWLATVVLMLRSTYLPPGAGQAREGTVSQGLAGRTIRPAGIACAAVAV